MITALAVLGLALLNPQAPKRTLAITQPGVAAIYPLRKPGAYALLVDNQGRQYELHYWPADKHKPPLVLGRISSYEAPTVSLDRRTLIAMKETHEEANVVDLDRWKLRRLEGWKPGFVGKTPAFIVAEERGTHIKFGNRKVRPPRGREFLILGEKPGLVVTERRAKPKGKGEDRFFMTLELWNLSLSGKLHYLRSLGVHWYDPASSGAPGVLSVAGNGLILTNSEGGGSVVSFPVIVPRRGKPYNPFDKLGYLEYAKLVGQSIAYQDGIVAEVVDVFGEDPKKSWFAWFEKSDIQLYNVPSGTISYWKEGNGRLRYAVRVPNGLNLFELRLPPKGWRKMPQGPHEPTARSAPGGPSFAMRSADRQR